MEKIIKKITEISTKYIISTEMGYYAGRNPKYPDMVNVNAKKYAFTFAKKETANKKAEYLKHIYFDKIEIQEVSANYTGKWDSNCFIVGENYN